MSLQERGAVAGGSGLVDTGPVPAAAVAPRAARTRGRAVERAVNVALPLLAVLALLGLWQLIVVARDVQPFVFPRLWGAQGDTLHALGTHWPDIRAGLLVTLEEAAWGFVLANVLAIVGASIFVYSRLAERMLYPIAVVVQTIPVIVVAPILVIILPTDSLYPEVIVAFLISFFPALVTMTNGLRAVDPLLLELFRVLNASGWQVYRKLRWPASIPYLFAALRITSTLSLIGAIVAEFTAGSGQGLGYELISAKQTIDTAQVMAIVLVIAATGVLVFGVVAGIERLALIRRGAIG